MLEPQWATQHVIMDETVTRLDLWVAGESGWTICKLSSSLSWLDR